MCRAIIVNWVCKSVVPAHLFKAAHLNTSKHIADIIVSPVPPSLEQTIQLSNVAYTDRITVISESSCSADHKIEPPRSTRNLASTSRLEIHIYEPYSPMSVANTSHPWRPLKPASSRSVSTLQPACSQLAVGTHVGS